MASSLRVVSFNGGLNSDQSHTSTKKRPAAEKNLHDFAAKANAAKADVVNMQEFSPKLAEFLLAQMSGYEIVPAC